MEKFDISPVVAVSDAAARAAPASPAAAAAAHIGPQNISNKILFKRHLTMSIYLIVLDGRNPAIPAAEIKKSRQRLKMSQEKKDTQREKERLSKNAKRQEENQEESDKHRKINCECMKR